MKTIKGFVFGFLCAVILTGTAALANNGFTAYISSQVFYYNNDKIELEAYNINDYNYVKLRDAAKLFGVEVEYSQIDDSVYLGEHTPPETTVATEKKRSDGKAYSKEDYSLNANQNIFNDVYTKDAYNAIKQTILDRNEISTGTDEYGYNKGYNYANFVDSKTTLEQMGDTTKAMKSVLNVLSGEYTYELGSAVDISNIYEYPGYSICMVKLNPKLEAAKTEAMRLEAKWQGLTDSEKVKQIANYISDKIVYRDESTVGTAEVFNSKTPVNGICGTYASAFKYLCSAVDIPCVTVNDFNHAWNEVYADGRWQIVDVGYYDVGRPDARLFIDNYWKMDENPQKTKFVKELLVPNSTKQLKVIHP